MRAFLGYLQRYSVLISLLILIAMVVHLWVLLKLDADKIARWWDDVGRWLSLHAWWILGAAGVFWFLVFLLAWHEGRPRRIGGERKRSWMMDILDRLSNRKVIESRLEQPPEPVLIDAEKLAAALKAKVIGQDRVCDDVAAQIRRRAALSKRVKPIGVFLLAGPPGTGKTYLAKCLAEALDRNLVHIDMAQLARGSGAGTHLFGSTKGYLGSDSYGALTSALRDTPDAVVLLDEFEKAHSDIHKNFLTAWNDGFITEASDGRQVATNKCIFMLTTNAATKKLADLARRYADEPDDLRRSALEVLEAARFAPEVLNRIDRIFVFHPLKGLDVARVGALEIEQFIKSYGLEIEGGGIDPEILLDLIDKYEKLEDLGSTRDVVRAIEERIGESLIEARTQKARRVRLDIVGGEVVAVVVSGDAELAKDAK